MVKYTAYFDGSCEPTNPGGKIGWGFVIKKDGETIYEGSGFEPAKNENTNNVAEYLAVTYCMDWLLDNNIREADIFGDSQLVVNQLIGDWRIKKGAYVQYALDAKEMHDTALFKLKWIPREKNEEADILATKCQEEVVLGGSRQKTCRCCGQLI